MHPGPHGERGRREKLVMPTMREALLYTKRTSQSDRRPRADQPVLQKADDVRQAVRSGKHPFFRLLQASPPGPDEDILEEPGDSAQRQGDIICRRPGRLVERHEGTGSSGSHGDQATSGTRAGR